MVKVNGASPWYLDLVLSLGILQPCGLTLLLTTLTKLSLTAGIISSTLCSKTTGTTVVDGCKHFCKHEACSSPMTICVLCTELINKNYDKESKV
jgi:hypothetical protein